MWISVEKRAPYKHPQPYDPNPSTAESMVKNGYRTSQPKAGVAQSISKCIVRFACIVPPCPPHFAGHVHVEQRDCGSKIRALLNITVRNHFVDATVSKGTPERYVADATRMLESTQATPTISSIATLMTPHACWNQSKQSWDIIGFLTPKSRAPSIDGVR